MADLGAIAVSTQPLVHRNDLMRYQVENIEVGGNYFPIMKKDTNIGNPTAPSLYIQSQGFVSFTWPVTAGTRTISVTTLQTYSSSMASIRPSMIVVQNTVAGVSSSVSASAAIGSGWTTIGPITVNPSTSSALEVRLYNNVGGQVVPCWFDHIITT